jgi:hypothetical protein
VPSQPLSEILDTGLGNNGGPTRTHEVVVDNPAIDATNNGTCPPPARDQRGVRRPQDGNHDGAAICDTGAFERRAYYRLNSGAGFGASLSVFESREGAEASVRVAASFAQRHLADITSKPEILKGEVQAHA